MKKYTYILILAIALLFSPIAQVEADVSQGATTIIRDCWRMENDAVPQWNYGNRSVVFSDDFTVTNTFFPTGGLVEIDVVAGAGGGITTVYTDLPVIGDGTVGDPIDISTAIAGYGLSMTTNIIDVNTGSGAYIDGSNNVAVGWNDRAGHMLTFDSMTLTADTTYVWPDVPAANDYICLFDTDGSMEFVPQTSVTSVESLDEAYDEGHSITVDDGPVEWTAPVGLGSSIHGYGVNTHYNVMSMAYTDTDKVLALDYVESDDIVPSIDTANLAYKIMARSEDSGSTVMEEFGFYLGGAFEVGRNSHGGVVRIYDQQGDATGYIELQTVANLAGGTPLIFPNNSAGYFLNDGSGNISYGTPADTDEKAKVSSDDTTAGYLDGKLTAGTGISFIVGNGGGNEFLTISNTIADTDTDLEAICIGDTTYTTITNIAPTTIAYASCIPYTGTAKYTGVYIQTWTPDLGNVDTITFTLYVDGVAKDTWTTNTGTAGSFGGAVDEALTQGHYVEVRGQVTTLVTALDTIRVQSCVINVQVK